MAHFARIDEHNKVAEIIVVANEVITDDNGVEQESLGQAFIASLGMEGTWLQCSYNGNHRNGYPGRGWLFREDLDAFIRPQPHASWVLNEDALQWEAPVPMPETGAWVWDEALGAWVEVEDEAV
jgi:hypothetical protein